MLTHGVCVSMHAYIDVMHGMMNMDMNMDDHKCLHAWWMR